jgi:alcohol dehydrogenase class IV
VHATESWVAAAATPLTRTWSREAFALVLEHLPRVVDDPDDLDSWLQLQLGAFFAGATLFNSGAGPAGALSYPLGVLHGVPHGLAGAFFLAPVAEWNLAHGTSAYDGLLPGLGPDEPVRRIRELSGRLGLPTSLAAHGVSEEDLDTIVEQTFLLEGALLQNPVPVDREALRGLLAQLC